MLLVFEGSAVERYQGAGDREPQARAGGAVRVLTAKELVEGPRAVFSRDPGAVVAHLDAKGVSFAVRGDEDRRAMRGVADGVDDEVRKCLVHLAPVGDNTGRIWIDVQRDPLPLLFGEDGVVGDHVPDERDRVDLLSVERDLSFLETRHLEKLRGEVLEAPDVPLGALGELALGGG